jgi:hypothetical protein
MYEHDVDDRLVAFHQHQRSETLFVVHRKSVNARELNQQAWQYVLWLVRAPVHRAANVQDTQSLPWPRNEWS